MRRNKRRFGSQWDREEDTDPMSGLANLADVMLVFACGLMMALILHWNVDIGLKETLDPENLEEVGNSEAIDEEALEGERFQSEGTVYRDTETGKLYIVTQ